MGPQAMQIYNVILSEGKLSVSLLGADSDLQACREVDADELSLHGDGFLSEEDCDRIYGPLPESLR